MDIGYLVSAIIVSMGYFSGLIISQMAKEELFHGKKYFRLAKNLALASLFFIYGSYILNSILPAAILTVVAGSIAFAADYRTRYAHAAGLIYPVLVSIMVFETYGGIYFNAVSLFSFTYMMLYAGQASDAKHNFRESASKIMQSYLLFMVTSLALWFVF